MTVRLLVVVVGALVGACVRRRAKFAAAGMRLRPRLSCCLRKEGDMPMRLKIACVSECIDTGL